MSKKIPKKRGPKPKRHKSSQQIAKTAAQKKEARLSAPVPKGKKRAATTGRIAERRVQAEMAKKDKKAALDVETKRVLKEVLKPLAKEINHRIKQASQLDDKADDHRLSAALQLEAARRQCKDTKISFEKWCEKNVEKSFIEIRQLIAVAKAPDPTKAIAYMRAGAAQRNRDLRKRQKVSRDITAPASRAESAWEAAEALVSSLPDEQQVSLMQARAGDIGMAVVSETEKNILTRLQKEYDEKAWHITHEEVYKMFLSLTAKDKLILVKEITEHLGGEFTHDFNTDDPGIPEKMRRDKGNGPRTAKV